MKVASGELRPSATDLVSFLNCHHLTELEKAAARGAIEKPRYWDPGLEALWARGLAHERDYVEHLRVQGFEPTTIEGVSIDDKAVADTLAAMRAGAPVIVQAALRDGRWSGRADILLRVEKQSQFGDWSYEAVDTKLARATKAGTVMQLSLYSELLAKAQGLTPEHMYVVQPWTDFEPERYRMADFGAFYRRVKVAFETALDREHVEIYPDPVAHCDICTWQPRCNARRRADDHLSLVAGISKLQTTELQAHGINRLADLAVMPLPLAWKPERGSALSFERVREQARLQAQARDTGTAPYELLGFEQGFGLSLLPAPNEGDVFLDFEGDPFVGDGGLEYLTGFHFRESGEWKYLPLWALTRVEEKAAFEGFIDFIMARWQQFPDLHIYHYGAYERSALTRLMGRYATREDELDQMLRAGLLVDLLTVVRQGIRAGVESYSIKKLEPLYGFIRDAALPDANVALTKLQISLEFGDLDSISDHDRDIVRRYNWDDCVSTQALRDWLELRRDELIAEGHDVQRPQPGESDATENVTEWLALITPLIAALTSGVPVEASERTDEQHARWLLANLLDFHRREDKASWWEKFRLAALPVEDLRDEKAALADLEYVATVGGTAACPIDRYRFTFQESDVQQGKKVLSLGGNAYGEVADISYDELTIDIKKRKDTAGMHAQAVFMHDHIRKGVLQQSLVRLAQYVVEHGVVGDGPYRAGRDLLLRAGPPVDAPLRNDGESVLDACKRLAPLLVEGVLPLQGPPGTGKTFTGAHMICDLVQAGKKVGIVANGHSVIRNLIDKVIEVADEQGIELRCVQKPDEMEADQPRLHFAKSNQALFDAIAGDCSVAGGTAWLWSTPEAIDSVDVLFVDEAAQMALANTLAVSQAAPAMVLLGDPQQLDQPMQGTHPDGTGCSALHHLLDGEQTIDEGKGLFLDKSWRLHPDICEFTSELFYEGKLTSRPDLATQALGVSSAIGGAGLRFVPVDHQGNTNCSPEEAQVIAQLVNEMLEACAVWTNRHGETRALTLDDVLIIAPYNAQVLEIRRSLPGANVGTVDKFQGRERPIAIYSLATSSHADAPRGMEFLYSANRLNVATSRARCVSIIVASPNIFEADARTPRQMQLANAFCRFLELT